MAKNFLNLGMETDIQIQQLQRTPYKMNSKIVIPRHIRIQMSEVRDKRESLKQHEKKNPNDYIQGIHHIDISRFLSRNFLHHKGVT